MALTMAVSPLVTLVRRAISRDIRPYDEGEPMDVCMQWRSRLYEGRPLYLRRGMLHITLCAHEGLRAVVRRRMERAAADARKVKNSWAILLQLVLASYGVFILPMKHTRRVSLFFFVFCLSLEWCWKPSAEIVDVFDVASSHVKR